jgi:hypothetical protein
MDPAKDHDRSAGCYYPMFMRKEKQMSILPEGEQLRKAVKWISDQRTEHPEFALFSLIEKACLKFDLTPKDGEFLMRHITEQDSKS